MAIWINAVLNFEIPNSSHFAGLARMIYFPLLEETWSTLLEDHAETSAMRGRLVPLTLRCTLSSLSGNQTNDNNQIFYVQPSNRAPWYLPKGKLIPTKKPICGFL